MFASRSAATPARLASVAAALALFATLLGAAALPPAAVRGGAALPVCRYDDILTEPRSYADWSITLVDTILRVPKTYVPPDLVRVVDLGIPGRGKVRSVMADDLKAMSAAAKEAGAAIGVVSAYRSYAKQQQVFSSWVAQFGYARALQVSARPGHSEHQLGLAIDFRSNPADDLALDTDWAGTPAGKWMKAHAWEYGFLMSYPKGSIAKTCYDWEPWHYRYVGKDLAATIHASGLTTREYLWANFTTVTVPPPPPATHKPVVTAAPSGTAAPPSSSPAPSPTELAPTATPAATPAASTPGPTTAPIPGPTPQPTPVPSDAGGFAASGWFVLAGAGALVAVIVVGIWLALRRGRSGVGL